MTDAYAQATLSGLNQALTMAGGLDTVVRVEVTGTFVGSLILEVDRGAGFEYVPPSDCYNVYGSMTSPEFTAPDIRLLALPGYVQYRLRMRAYTSGSALVTMQGAQTQAASAGGRSLPLSVSPGSDTRNTITSGDDEATVLTLYGHSPTQDQPLLRWARSSGQLDGYIGAWGGLVLRSVDAQALALDVRGASGQSVPPVRFSLDQSGTRLTVTGSRGGNAALASLLTALQSLGIIIDGTS